MLYLPLISDTFILVAYSVCTCRRNNQGGFFLLSPPLESTQCNLTGGAAKSIQSINVAAVVAVAAAAAVAGLASPAATHYMKKLCVWRKTALFFSFFNFFEQPYLFSPCPCPP